MNPRDAIIARLAEIEREREHLLRLLAWHLARPPVVNVGGSSLAWPTTKPK